ncbi:MAG TPA: MOSC domain-containing protein [Devosiaceae bacterium]|nr:MOSC domain-containing protein [Devosiaceae bacterium]
MRLLSINVGRAAHIEGHSALTGICKRPVSGAVAIGTLGLEGDAVLDQKHHGGLDQAIYLYGQPDYEFFEHETRREMAPGLFGENLTVAGLESQTLHIGDRFEIGEVLLEITSPRIPCATFAARMGDPHWVKRFFAVNRPGAYCRVLAPGLIEAGMPIRYIPFAGPKVPLVELMHDYKNPAPERMRYLMQAPIHRKLVERYQGHLFPSAVSEQP